MYKPVARIRVISKRGRLELRYESANPRGVKFNTGNAYAPAGLSENPQRAKVLEAIIAERFASRPARS